jgi:hypothetical protein
VQHGCIEELRATRMIQDKAQVAGNGRSFSRTATPYWIIRVAPVGRAGKRSSAVVRLLARTRHCRRDSASGFYALRVQPLLDLAEPINTTLLDH